MNRDLLNEKFELLLSEGVHDHGIFKAVFLNGGPGSGKDYVLNNVLKDHGLTEINSDKLHDHLTSGEHNFNKTSPDIPKEKIKNVSHLRQLLSIHGRNGLIVNGTGDDHTKTKEIKKKLEGLGYDTVMIHVHADDEVSKKRNIERNQRGGRAIPETQRKKKWDDVQNARMHHAKLFGSNYLEFDNSHDLREAPPELVKQKRDELSQISDYISNFVNTVPESEKSQKWIDRELKTNETSIPRKGTKLPHPDSNAGLQAKELGLTYFGNGKYGKDRTVTHHSISDNLVEIPKEGEKPVKKKKLSEIVSTLNESISITITGDTTGEVIDMVKSLGSGDCTSKQSENQNDYLTLGKKVDTIGKSSEGSYLTNVDVEKMLAREGKNELNKEDIKDTEGFFLTEDCSGDTSTTEKKVSVREKINGESKKFSQLRSKIKESIDKGIEPGLSMATSGENLCRPTSEKNKRSGKSGINELTGDETTASIGDQKEDELKKKGISLVSLRSKKVI